MSTSITAGSTAEVDAARLRLALARLNRRLRNADASMELTESQLFALGAIDVHGPLRLSDLALRERVSAPTATRLVASLEERGLVRKQTNPDDRRSTLLALTPAGRRMLDRVRGARTVALSRGLERLDPADLRALAVALPVIERLASEGDSV